jgi:6,7-dimethyl-8-ribityllumazine synthase
LRDKDHVVTLAGTNRGAGLKFAVVVARFNDFVTDRLQAGAVDALTSAGVRSGDIIIIKVPGAFEIPFAATQAARQGQFAAVICLGCLIRGATAHFEYIAGAASQGIMTASVVTGVPMTFGVLTTNSKEEALERAIPGPANKGWEAAVAAVEMATLRVSPVGVVKRARASKPHGRGGRAGRGAPARKK